MMAKVPETIWYDMQEDWPLIEASFAKQYGIRLRGEDNMTFSEFQELLAGLMPDTPLGNIISIRSETNKDVIKNFTSSQRQEHNKWKNRIAQDKLKDPEKLDKMFSDLEKAFAIAYTEK